MRSTIDVIRVGLIYSFLVIGPFEPLKAQDVERVTTGSAENGPNISAEILNDPEAAFQFARRAVEAGDIRGAITALERVLQMDPGLANIKLELGLLYLRVGQYDLARSLLESAIESPDAPEAARERARQAIGVSGSNLSQVAFNGSIFLGGQYQTNPNGSPGAVSVIGPGGAPIIIDGSQLSSPRGDDVSFTVAGNSELSIGLGGQRGNAIVLSNAIVYNEYDETDDLDALYLDGKIGPQLFLGSALSPTGYVRPYVQATHLNLGGSTFYNAYGGGFELLLQEALTSTYRIDLSYKRRDYSNSNNRPRATDQTGDYWALRGTASFQLAPRTRIEGTGFAELVNARQDYWSRSSFGIGFTLSQAIRPFFGSSVWFGRLGASYQHSNYQDPDPFIDPNRERSEDRFSIEGDLSIPLASSVSLELRAQQTWNESNIVNYEFSNTLFSIGTTIRF